MKILAINAGSSSLKFQLIEMPQETVLASGIAERIGLSGAGNFTINFADEKIETQPVLENHATAVEQMLSAFEQHKIITHISEISGVGHRVVHGGESFSTSVVVTPDVEKEIAKLSNLAPLHNPANLDGIQTFIKLLPNAMSVAVFDTAFHQTMTKEAFMYPVPPYFYDKYQVRKYGFHGTSHMYVSQVVNELLGKKDSKVIVAHLGNGASICAVENGKSIDTSMGFTPLAGVMMGTRSGDIDPAIIAYMCEKTKKSADEITNELNKASGMAGVSNVSSDMRDIKAAVASGDEKAKLAFDMYIKRLAEYIAMYIVNLNGADAIAFTAGIGENASEVREAVVNRLAVFGIKIDKEANQQRGQFEFSKRDSAIKLFTIPTNEEIVIARDTYNLMVK